MLNGFLGVASLINYMSLIF